MSSRKAGNDSCGSWLTGLSCACISSLTLELTTASNSSSNIEAKEEEFALEELLGGGGGGGPPLRQGKGLR